ncbi:ABC transporter ATP-binding protein [Candidatus Sumerlaeota bacterium]|nr:ABC transporter ATP-binding protein [Candidatus Sumerlaeota bacterium]
MNQPEISSLRLLRWYVGKFRGDKLRIASGVLISLVQAIIVIPIPLILRHVIDVSIPARDTADLAKCIVLAAILYAANAGMSYSAMSLTLRATKRVTEKLRARLCMQLQQISLRFYDKEKASELHSSVVLDTERIDIMGNAIISHLMTSLVMFLLGSALLAYVNMKLFLVMLLVLPLYIVMHHFNKRRMREVHQQFNEGMKGMSSLVNDLLQTIRLVKTFAREAHEQNRAEKQFRTVTERALAMTIFSAYYGSLMNFLSNMMTLTVYLVGGFLIIRNSMTLGDLVAFAGMIAFLVNPINVFMGNVSNLFQGLASLRPVHSLLTLNDPLEINEGKEEIATLRGSVEFDHVSFYYDNPQHMALRDVDINVRPGQTIALVGESGAGKSTFASLLLGFYEPTQGAIRIDGRDLRDLNLRKLREQIGVVTQDNVMLNTSIRDNLLYGKLNATDEELERATRDAFAHDFIQAIPDGMDAIVGDRGVRLSGGQRQRLAIARALLKNPQVLILDEATSALDSESEAQIQKAMERLQADRTCIIIAHRLSTVMSADRILVFRDGTIVESGTHGELLEFGGEYARLCDRQFSPGNSPKPTEFP